MALSTAALERAIDGALLPEGFEKRRRAWYLESPECVGVLELRTASKWPGLRYLDLGVSVERLSSERYPRAHQSHAIGSAPVVAKHPEALATALDLRDASLSLESRLRVIQEELREGVVPFLRRMSTLEGIRREALAGTLRQFLILRTLRDLLALD